MATQGPTTVHVDLETPHPTTVTSDPTRATHDPTQDPTQSTQNPTRRPTSTLNPTHHPSLLTRAPTRATQDPTAVTHAPATNPTMRPTKAPSKQPTSYGSLWNPGDFVRFKARGCSNLCLNEKDNGQIDLADCDTGSRVRWQLQWWSPSHMKFRIRNVDTQWWLRRNSNGLLETIQAKNDGDFFEIEYKAPSQQPTTYGSLWDRGDLVRFKARGCGNLCINENDNGLIDLADCDTGSRVQWQLAWSPSHMKFRLKNEDTKLLLTKNGNSLLETNVAGDFFEIEYKVGWMDNYYIKLTHFDSGTCPQWDGCDDDALELVDCSSLSSNPWNEFNIQPLDIDTTTTTAEPTTATHEPTHDPTTVTQEPTSVTHDPTISTS
eukprot:894739_1